MRLGRRKDLHNSSRRNQGEMAGYFEKTRKWERVGFSEPIRGWGWMGMHFNVENLNFQTWLSICPRITQSRGQRNDKAGGRTSRAIDETGKELRSNHGHCEFRGLWPESRRKGMKLHISLNHSLSYRYGTIPFRKFEPMINRRVSNRKQFDPQPQRDCSIQSRHSKLNFDRSIPFWY